MHSLSTPSALKAMADLFALRCIEQDSMFRCVDVCVWGGSAC